MNTGTCHNAAVFAYDTYERFHPGIETYAANVDLEDAYNRVPCYVLLHQQLELTST